MTCSDKNPNALIAQCRECIWRPLASVLTLQHQAWKHLSSMPCSGRILMPWMPCAETAYGALGSLSSSEEIVFVQNRDDQHRSLLCVTGNNYTINFTLPIPANAWWSLTLYTTAGLALVNNTINRYSINEQVSSVPTFATFIHSAGMLWTHFLLPLRIAQRLWSILLLLPKGFSLKGASCQPWLHVGLWQPYGSIQTKLRNYTLLNLSVSWAWHCH